MQVQQIEEFFSLEEANNFLVDCAKQGFEIQSVTAYSTKAWDEENKVEVDCPCYLIVFSCPLSAIE